MFIGVNTFIEHFNWAATMVAGTPNENGWTILDTSAAGTPTYASSSSDGGQFVITAAADDEAENIVLCQNDVLNYDIDSIQYMGFVASVAGVAATNVITMGLGSARAADEDTVANHAWFKVEGAASTSAIVCETDDGVIDNDDKATGQSLSSTPKLFEIDFSFGKSDIRFAIEGRRVGHTQAFPAFSMANATGAMQPYFGVDKSGAGTDASVPALTLKYVIIISRFQK